LFASAIHAAALDERRAREPVAVAPAAPAPDASAVAAPAAPVDLARADWPERMLGHIERLRDVAELTSTRIRVSPDALGPIDLQVRRDGDAVHVHFHAAEPDTRALLNDARPQLAQAAAERGVRLGQTSVGGGPGEQPGARRDAPAPRAPARPASTLSDAGDEPADIRIA
jgi:flagellar hook-length control protein FliK